LEKVVSHDILVGSMPPYLHDTKRLKHTQQLFENLKSGLVNHLTSTRSFKFIAKDILCKFVTSESMGSSRGTTKLLGVNRRNIRKVIDRRLALDTLGNAFWTDYRRAKRADVLSKRFTKCVIEWWTI